MSAEAMAWSKRQRISDRTLTAVLSAIAWRANPEGVCWPSQATIAEETGLTDRSVRRALAMLDRLGVISRKARSNGRAGRASDLLSIELSRDFTIGRQDVAVSRAVSPTGHSVRLQEFQPDTASSATGHSVQGINIEQTEQDLAKGQAPRRLKVSTAPMRSAEAGRTPLRAVTGEAAR